MNLSNKIHILRLKNISNLQMTCMLKNGHKIYDKGSTRNIFQIIRVETKTRLRTPIYAHSMHAW